VPEPEFVTISRASILLGVNERSARRAAGHLSDTDRQISAGCPTLIRLSALASQMGKPLPVVEVSDTSPGLSDKEESLSDKAPDTSAGVSDTHEGSDTALVDQLRSEVEYLRAALAASQQIASQAQQLQLLAERRVGELEGKLLPARDGLVVDGGTNLRDRSTEEMRSGFTSGDSSAVSTAGEGIVPLGTVEAQNEAQGKRSGFWARLWRRG
jgi:hypothetical protein